ncbi:MAG: hypothetical protein GKR89_03905 [Candidatus Latescibacteria bacterium]|nr:hypothetical protein [Candidatus Latescibacterota bacterium]
MPKQRIQVYADDQTKRRIELAAAKRAVPVTEYCMAAIEDRLADDEMLDAQKVEIDIVSQPDKKLIADLKRRHKRVLARRQGQPLDPAILDIVRQEREEEQSDLY